MKKKSTLGLALIAALACRLPAAAAGIGDERARRTRTPNRQVIAVGICGEALVRDDALAGPRINVFLPVSLCQEYKIINERIVRFKAGLYGGQIPVWEIVKNSLTFEYREEWDEIEIDVPLHSPDNYFSRTPAQAKDECESQRVRLLAKRTAAHKCR